MSEGPTSPPTPCPVCGARTEAEQFWCGYPGCPDGRGRPGPERYDVGGSAAPVLLAALAAVAAALGLMLLL